VREEYLRLAEEFGFEVIDASEDPESVVEEAMRRIGEVL
jgi:thymidylate kinase